MAATTKPRRSREVLPGSRQVPASVKRQVWTRDGGQCAFAGTQGRCTERGFLEIHHIVPFADGGSTTVDNLALRCRAHNLHEAEEWFGLWQVREVRPIYHATRSGPSRRAGSSVGADCSTRPPIGRDVGELMRAISADRRGRDTRVGQRDTRTSDSYRLFRRGDGTATATCVERREILRERGRTSIPRSASVQAAFRLRLASSADRC